MHIIATQYNSYLCYTIPLFEKEYVPYSIKMVRNNPAPDGAYAGTKIESSVRGRSIAIAGRGRPVRLIVNLSLGLLEEHH